MRNSHKRVLSPKWKRSVISLREGHNRTNYLICSMEYIDDMHDNCLVDDINRSILMQGLTVRLS